MIDDYIAAQRPELDFSRTGQRPASDVEDALHDAPRPIRSGRYRMPSALVAGPDFAPAKHLTRGARQDIGGLNKYVVLMVWEMGTLHTAQAASMLIDSDSLARHEQKVVVVVAIADAMQLEPAAAILPSVVALGEQ